MSALMTFANIVRSSTVGLVSILVESEENY